MPIPAAMLLGSVLLLPLCGASTLYGHKDATIVGVTAQVNSEGSTHVKRHKLLRKEVKLDHDRFEDSAGVASLLAEAGKLSTKRSRAGSRYLPQYPTGPATCDGSQLKCPADSSVDPCSQLQNCSTGGHHDCQGSFKICLPNKENPAKCESGDDCLLRCTGTFMEEKSDGSEGVPVCSDLSQDSCNGHYVADKDYLNNGLGYECHMKDDKTCGNGKLCGVQNPPESLGEKQCFEPEVFKGATDGTCATFRTRPGQECKTRCYAGYSPSVAALKCNEDGQFEPKTFTCEPNPCTVKSVQNALASGCKEGPNSGEAVIQSGEVCTTQCKDGFYPSDKLLHCHSETLSPATFTCESPCVVPTVANAAGGGVCKEAGEGEKILPFTSCTTQCAAGYTQSVRYLSCRSGTFTPKSVECKPDPCDAPVGVKFVSKEGSCKEGKSLTSGSSCTSQCLAGYTPSVATLACNAATLTPATFTCNANPCVIPTVEKSSGNGCKGVSGKTVESGKVCDTMCKAGYTPSVKRLNCLAETLTPATFVCNPDPCPIPFDKNQEASGCIGVKKNGATVIESSETCRTQCKEGYHPSSAKLSCFAGELSPATWSCEEDPCPALKNIKNAPELTCRQGDSIISGTVCTTFCSPGYTPSPKSLSCSLGDFTPATYVCKPDPCPLHLVPNRLGSGCKGVTRPAVIQSGDTCETQCEEGYSPSVKGQKCFAGSLTPTFWSCEPDPCEPPAGIRNAAPNTCKEGKSVSSGGLCTSQCADGYSPSVSSLACNLGKLAPATFTCIPDPCQIPEVSDRHGSGCRGIKGKTVNSGVTCTPVCKTGFQPSEQALRCAASKLTPATWTCDPDSCIVKPGLKKAMGTGCNGGKSGRVASGGVCKGSCLQGYAPSVSKLDCYAGIFSPESFTCDPEPCKIPTVQNRAGSGCMGIPGDSIASSKVCNAHCQGGYSPSAAKLSCSAGTLTPATFECSPDPCPMPKVGNQLGNGCKGMAGTIIASGGTCETVCARGYTPSVAKLACFAGTLKPNAYICQEDKCKAVTGVPNAPTVACQEGQSIIGGKSCTPRCNAGFSPSITSLACSRGTLNPTTFQCRADNCDVPYVANSLNPTCSEGNNIAHNKRCTPRCKSGYLPSSGSLKCTAGVLRPATFVCKAPCAAPNVLNTNQLCREGRLVSHGRSCTTQCNAGYLPSKASLQCVDGVLTSGPVWCESAPPPIGGNFYNCWTGDPHFVCSHGRRSDPLVPGTHWVLKQSCPGSPNFMWVQGLFGPVRPACTMGTAFGGHFLGKNVITIRSNNNPSWIVKWNGQNIVNAWKRSGHNTYKYNLGGTELSLTWSTNHLQLALSYGVTYKAQRSHWRRQKNIRVSGFYYTDFYTQNNLWAKTCRNGVFRGEAVELHRGYRPHGDDRMVSADYDMFQKSNSQIEAKLDSLTTMASLLDAGSDGVELVDVNVSEVDEQPCKTAQDLEGAKKNCAVLKKEETQEEQEELDEDAEAKKNQDNTYNACIADICSTASKDFGNAAKETEEESEMESALKHKKELRTASLNEECKTGWRTTDGADSFLYEAERSRANQKKDKCNQQCQVCRPEHRRFLMGPTVLHNETQDACMSQQLAMPKSDGDRTRLWILQKKFSDAEKGWLGGRFKDGVWTWSDDTSIEGMAAVAGNAGDYVCLDRDEGKLINCEHRPDVRHDSLCEVVYY